MRSQPRQFGFRCDGVGWIDCHLLAAAVGYETRLWSADKRVVRAARHVSVAFEP